MIGRWLASVLALAGCGRLGFDAAATTDAAPDARPSPPGCSAAHDEDRDGVDDCADVCPHLPDPAQPDADGDGVGDACDPHPDQPRDRIAAWEPLTSPPAGWLTSIATPTGDGLVVDGRTELWGGELDLIPADDTFAIGGTVEELGAASDHQIALILSDYPRTYYCELYAATGTSLNFTYTFDQAAYTNVDVTPIADLAPGQRYQLVMHRAATEVACSGALDGADHLAGGPTPPIDASHVVVQIYKLRARLDYFIRIHSD